MLHVWILLVGHLIIAVNLQFMIVSTNESIDLIYH